MKQNFALPDDFSILLTVFLPLTAVLGSLLNAWLHRHLSDFVAIETLHFTVTACAIGGVVYGLTRSFPFTLICFAVTTLLQEAVNNVNTSMVPIFLNHEADSGMISGIINTFCYTGSTVSSYGLGALADRFGWNGVFRVLWILAAVPTVVGTVLVAVRRYRAKKRS